MAILQISILSNEKKWLLETLKWSCAEAENHRANLERAIIIEHHSYLSQYCQVFGNIFNLLEMVKYSCNDQEKRQSSSFSAKNNYDCWAERA